MCLEMHQDGLEKSCKQDIVKIRYTILQTLNNRQ